MNEVGEASLVDTDVPVVAAAADVKVPAAVVKNEIPPPAPNQVISEPQVCHRLGEDEIHDRYNAKFLIFIQLGLAKVMKGFLGSFVILFRESTKK